MLIYNAEALEAIFGQWPSFHDAEVLAVRLDSGQRSDGRVRLELDIHVFDVDGRTPSDRLNFTRHTVVTLQFEGVEHVELEEFGPQNVLDDLVLTEHGPGYVSRSRIQVELPSNNGLAGSFYCEELMVLAVAPHDPGPHSVYGRDL